MPAKNSKLLINLDLLRPQGNPEKLHIRLIRWLLSTGRYIFIFVEALVLAAFILRFKLDADLATKKEAIEEQIPFIESLKPYEVLIKQTQLKLQTIQAFNQNIADYPLIVKKIADQTPTGVKILNISLVKGVGKITTQINAQAQNNNDLTNFVFGMKEDKYFSEVNLLSVSLDQGIIHFTITAATSLSQRGEKSL